VIPTVDAERVAGYANAEKAAATRRAYAVDFAIFRAWCAERGLGALPPSPPFWRMRQAATSKLRR
jgi:hypothetical protein